MFITVDLTTSSVCLLCCGEEDVDQICMTRQYPPPQPSQAAARGTDFPTSAWQR